MSSTPIPPNNPSHELLTRAHSPDIASRIFTEKIHHKPLFLRATSPSSRSNARTQRQQTRLAKKAAERKSTKPRPLSAKQKRKLGVYDIPKEQQKYSIYIPLWRLWCSYIRDVLGVKTASESGQGGHGGFVTPAGAGPMLCSADLHGAYICVVRSRCVSRVGVRGIVVRDTKSTFDIVTEKNGLKSLPKEHTVFRIEVPVVEQDSPGDGDEERGDGGQGGDGKKNLVFEIYGERFMSRATDRATKKVGLHIAKDI